MKRATKANAPALASTPVVQPSRRPAPLPQLKAGEAIPVYGAHAGACGLRYALRKREMAVVEKALQILGTQLNNGREVFDTPGAVETYLRLHLGGETSEHFALLLLDSQHRAIAFERLFAGTLTQTSVYPREVVDCVLRHRAAEVVLAHNHPSGSVAPSRADEALTETLKKALALIDVRVLDHVIVSASGACSMAVMGLV